MSYTRLSDLRAASTRAKSYVNAMVTAITEAISEVASALDGHAGNKNNPHGVTAAQLGVYTKAEVDALLENVLVASENETNET